MKVKVFQPFQRVWTPRTPDSGYDSFGTLTPPNRVVPVALPTAMIDSTLTFIGGAYYAATAITGAIESLDQSTKFVSGTYTA